MNFPSLASLVYLQRKVLAGDAARQLHLQGMEGAT